MLSLGLLLTLIGPISPVKAGTPFIQQVRYVSPTTIDVVFSEAMDATTTQNTANYTLATSATGDNHAITSATLATTNTANDTARIVANLALISPSMSDTITIATGAGAPKSSATSTNQTDGFPMMAMLQQATVAISEIQTAGGTATDEFIELYNRTPGAVDLTNWKLKVMDSAGNEAELISNIGIASLAGNKFALFTHATGYDGTPTGDGTYSAAAIGDDSTVLLYDNNNIVRDIVGFGSAKVKQGDVITSNPAANGSLERKSHPGATAESMASGGSDATQGNNYSSSNNFYDFVTQTVAVPQSTASPAEAPVVGGGGGTGFGAGRPNIEFMPIMQWKDGADLKVIARVFDPETAESSLTTALHYKVNAGSWTSVSGFSMGSNFFKFIIPDAAFATTDTISYFLKATDGDSNDRYMTQNPTLDMSDTTTDTDAQSNPFTFSIVDGSGWARTISGTVTDSASVAVANAIVYLVGTGFSATTAGDGTYTISNVTDGIYDGRAFASSKGDMWKNGVTVNGGNATGVNFSLPASFSGGMGGDFSRPKVMFTAPFEGMSGAPENINTGFAPIMIGFNKDMDASTFVSNDNVFISTDGSTAVVGLTLTRAYDGGTKQLTLSSTTALTKGTNYVVVLTPNVKDASGNSIDGNTSSGNFIFSFTTAFDGSTFGGTGGAVFPPYVTGTTPSFGAFNVATNAKMRVIFSDPMDTSTISTTTIKVYEGASSTALSGTTVTLDTSTRKTATITTASALTASTKYTIKVFGGVKSATGIFGRQTTTEEMMRAEFTTGTATDSAAPRVAGGNLDIYKSTATCAVSAVDCITNVPGGIGVINLGFTENMDPSTITSSSVVLKKGSVEVSTTVSFDPLNNTVTIAPLTALSPLTTYTLTVATTVLDSVSNALDQDTVTAGSQGYTALFKTSDTVDTTAPTVLYAAADDFSVAVTFSKPMNASKLGDTGYTNSVLNKDNYSTIKQGAAGTDFAGGGGTAVPLTNASVTYDAMSNTAIIKGVQLTAGNDLYIVVNNAAVKDVSGNLLNGSANASTSPIKSSATTGGMIGPGGGGMMNFSSGEGSFTTMTGFGGFEASAMGTRPVGVMPMNQMAGLTSKYFIDLPVTKAIVDASTLVLTFPSGFDVTNAAKDAASPSSKDMNGPGAGTITFDNTYSSDGVSSDVLARTVTVKFDVTGTPSATDFLHLDLDGIKNSSIPKDFNTSGYTVDMKTRDSAGVQMDSSTSMPFFITAAGTYTISGTITAAGASTGTAKIFLGSPATGPMETTSIAFSNGSATYTFNNLPASDYWLSTEPSVTLGANDYFGINNSEPIRLSATNSPLTKNLTLAAASGGAAVTVNIVGTFNSLEGNIDIFAGGWSGFAVKTVELNDTYGAGSPYSTTLRIPSGSDGTWYVGVGPAMPKGAMGGMMPEMSFVPPPSQEVKVTSGTGTASPSTLTFTVSTANRTISGTVTDGTTAISNAEVFAYQPMGGFGTPPTKTASDGTFTLKVADGTYKVGAMLPGLSKPVEQSVTVSGSNVSGITLKLSKPNYTISGKMTDGTNGVSYAPVWGYNETTGEYSNTMTDSSGNYILYVNAGTWKVEGDAPGYGKMPSITVTVTTTSQSNQNLRPGSTNMATVSGTVSIGGSATSKVNVWIEGNDSSGGRFNNYTVTASDGTYSLKVPGGTGYTVRAWTPNYGDLTPVVIGAIAEGAALTGKDFTIASGATATITVKFTNTSGLSATQGFVDIFNPTTGRGSHLDIKDITSNPTAAGTIALPKTSGSDTYKAFVHIPGFGEFAPTVVSGSLAQDFTLTADSNLNFSLPTSRRTITGRVYVDTNADSDYDSGEEIREAFVWLFNKTTGSHNGTQTASDGTYTLNVSDGTYDIGVDKPSYTSPAPTALTISGNLTDQNFVLSASDRTIGGTITSDGSTALTSAWVWAEKVTSLTDLTPAGGWAGGQTDPSGVYSLAVSAGFWQVRAVAPGYQETKYKVGTTPTVLQVAGSNLTGKNITLIAQTGFTAKAPQSQSITPGNATTFNDTTNGVSLEIPANTLGSDSSANTSLTVTEVAAPETGVKAPLGGVGDEVSATKKVSASESQSITTFDTGSATITLTYSDADIPAGISESQLTLSYYDTTAGQWTEIPAIQDTTLNTLTGTTTHFSTFAPTYPTGTNPPSTPGTPSGTAGNGSVALSWTASTDDIGLAGYEVYRSTTSGGTYTNISGDVDENGGWYPARLVAGTSYTDSTASNGTTYYYKISAYDAAGNQSTSSSASAGLTPAGGGGGGGGGGYIAPTPSNTINGSVVATKGLGGITTLTNSDSTAVKMTVPANAVTNDTTFAATAISATDATVIQPATSTNLSVVGKVYNLSAKQGSTAVTVFAQPVTLEFTYKDTDIPTGVTENNIAVYYFDTTSNSWVKITTSSIDKTANKITILVEHFTQFAILADTTPASQTPVEQTAGETPATPTTGVTPSNNPAEYNYEYVSQSVYPTIAPLASQSVTIKLKNTGTATWYKTGSYPVRLGTSHLKDRTSKFHDETNWLSGNRVASFQEASVAPGETGTFTFNMTAPLNKGSYKEYFQPVVEGLAWLKDIGIFWTVTVDETYSAKWMGQGFNSGTNTDGTKTVWIEFQNTGTATWKKTGDNPVRLGTSHEKDRASMFADSSWLATNRVELSQTEVKPGETGRFEFKIKISAGNAGTTYREYFQPVAEYLTWMEDWGVYWDIAI